MSRVVLTVTALAAVMIVVLAAHVTSAAQDGSRVSGSSAPRTPWGDPDLEGTWTADDSIGVPFERPPLLGTKRFLTDAELAELERQFPGWAQMTPPPSVPAAPDHWSEVP